MPQLEICLNDVRTDPLKYKSAYTCNYDTDLAPKLVPQGRRLPLNRADGMTTKAADRFLPAFRGLIPGKVVKQIENWK
jgi:hypothetical protein